MFWRTEVGAPLFYSACPCNSPSDSLRSPIPYSGDVGRQIRGNLTGVHAFIQS